MLNGCIQFQRLKIQCRRGAARLGHWHFWPRTFLTLTARILDRSNSRQFGMAGCAPLGVPGVRFHRVLQFREAGPLPRGARGLAKSAVSALMRLGVSLGAGASLGITNMPGS